MLDQVDLEWDLQMVSDLHRRPHNQMLDAVLGLSLANDVKKSLIVKIKSLTSQAI